MNDFYTLPVLQFDTNDFILCWFCRVFTLQLCMSFPDAEDTDQKVGGQGCDLTRLQSCLPETIDENLCPNIAEVEECLMLATDGCPEDIMAQFDQMTSHFDQVKEHCRSTGQECNMQKMQDCMSMMPQDSETSVSEMCKLVPEMKECVMSAVAGCQESVVQGVMEQMDKIMKGMEHCNASETCDEELIKSCVPAELQSPDQMPDEKTLCMQLGNIKSCLNPKLANCPDAMKEEYNRILNTIKLTQKRCEMMESSTAPMVISCPARMSVCHSMMPHGSDAEICAGADNYLACVESLIQDCADKVRPELFSFLQQAVDGVKDKKRKCLEGGKLSGTDKKNKLVFSVVFYSMFVECSKFDVGRVFTPLTTQIFATVDLILLLLIESATLGENF